MSGKWDFARSRPRSGRRRETTPSRAQGRVSSQEGQAMVRAARKTIARIGLRERISDTVGTLGPALATTMDKAQDSTIKTIIRDRRLRVKFEKSLGCRVSLRDP